MDWGLALRLKRAKTQPAPVSKKFGICWLLLPKWCSLRQAWGAVPALVRHPVVAEVAREMGLLTVAVVTAPYYFEGTDKKDQAREGIEKLKKSCDTVLVVLNDKLAELYSELTWTDAYAHADDVLANAVKSIAEIITTQGDINADFADVKKVLEGAGQSVMGSAEEGGDDRAIKAIEAALNSPLLNDHDIRGAKRILLTISSSKEHAMKLKEQMSISEHVAKKIQTEARMFKFGAITDKNLGDKLRVTIIAAGFEGTGGVVKELEVTPGTEPKHEPVDVVDPEQEPEVVDEEQQEMPTDEHGVEKPMEVAGPVGITINVAEKELTPTILNGTGRIISHSQPETETKPTYDNDNSTLVLDEEEERADDSDLIKKLVETFVKSQYTVSDLDRPAFERNKTVLHPMPMLPENEFVRSKLNE